MSFLCYFTRLSKKLIIIPCQQRLEAMCRSWHQLLVSVEKFGYNCNTKFTQNIELRILALFSSFRNPAWGAREAKNGNFPFTLNIELGWDVRFGSSLGLIHLVIQRHCWIFINEMQGNLRLSPPYLSNKTEIAFGDVF